MPSALLDCLGHLPVPASVQAQMSRLLAGPVRWSHEVQSTVHERLQRRAGGVVLLEARDWLDQSDYFQTVLGFNNIALRCPTLLLCREVEDHVDTEPAKQRLLYWTLYNDGFALRVEGTPSREFKAGEVFSFDPGVPHAMHRSHATPEGLWCGLAVPVNAQAYEYWRAALRLEL